MTTDEQIKLLNNSEQYKERENSFFESVVAEELNEEYDVKCKNESVVNGVVTNVEESSESVVFEVALPHNVILKAEFTHEDSELLKKILIANDVLIDNVTSMEDVVVPVYVFDKTIDEDSYMWLSDDVYAVSDFNSGNLQEYNRESLDPMLERFHSGNSVYTVMRSNPLLESVKEKITNYVGYILAISILLSILTIRVEFLIVPMVLLLIKYMLGLYIFLFSVEVENIVRLR